MKLLLTCSIILSAIGLGIWYECKLWDECLSDHTVFYCMRVLDK